VPVGENPVRRPRILSSPDLAQLSSRSSPGAPAAPIAPTTSLPRPIDGIEARLLLQDRLAVIYSDRHAPAKRRGAVGLSGVAGCTPPIDRRRRRNKRPLTSSPGLPWRFLRGVEHLRAPQSRGANVGVTLVPALRARAAAQAGFRPLSRLISRISRRISSGTLGLPPRRLDFQRQNDRNQRDANEPRSQAGRWSTRLQCWERGDTAQRTPISRRSGKQISSGICAAAH
jgi:hypothetical protein